MPAYPLVLTRDDDGTFLVTCPALPEVTSFGATETEARQNGTRAIEEALAARLARFQAGETYDDPDNPEWTEEDFAQAVPVDQLPSDLREALLAAFPKMRRT